PPVEPPRLAVPWPARMELHPEMIADHHAGIAWLEDHRLRQGYGHDTEDEFRRHAPQRPAGLFRHITVMSTHAVFSPYVVQPADAGQADAACVLQNSVVRQPVTVLPNSCPECTWHQS